ncbi:acid ceramidase-like [Dendronephthya gigantea]|uniref:acid ceramidase-like n=1 Tax=Dendronephthya gigantea TaxID=151771 RepID=UPI00106D7CDC|nr:acid ceramidase-like [Dendronephthya gigantea]
MALATLTRFGFLFLVFCSAYSMTAQKTVCNHQSYPPPDKDKVDTVVIDLDLEPEERWKDITLKKKPEILALAKEIKNFTSFIFDGKLFDYVDKFLPILMRSLPDPYGREIKGISSATGIPLGEILLFNIFYELTVACTSIIAETPSGKLFHARNLDFGLFDGWDVRTNTWAMAEALRPLVLNFDFQRKGKTVYITTGFPGFVGAFTGFRPGEITITMNSRFSTAGGKIGLLEWIMGERDSHWTTFLVRNVLDSGVGFDDAEKLLSNTKTLAPCYYLLGGNSSGQGMIISRSRTKSLYPLSMDQGKSGWYLLQTNYDHWKNPLIIDDRRTPGNECMEEMTQTNVGFKGIFNVLSTIPVLNKLTSYTAIMHVSTGEVRTYRRYCRDPCFPW